MIIILIGPVPGLHSGFGYAGQWIVLYRLWEPV